MDGESHVGVSALDDRNAQFIVMQGSVNARVRDLQPGENFEVDTPHRPCAPCSRATTAWMSILPAAIRAWWSTAARPRSMAKAARPSAWRPASRPASRAACWRRCSRRRCGRTTSRSGPPSATAPKTSR
ncbi:hypothetical protein HK414_27815 [Ramlibacter terrae]|uniref:Cupin domain-containing protein n=1 Tax=Ramlibacter terrae TaxID=2732511 RepID=A0ABX6P8G6_9BURK|nr:hypothetical protein HK414_27815 [Ramlibacter terrae]